MPTSVGYHTITAQLTSHRCPRLPDPLTCTHFVTFRSRRATRSAYLPTGSHGVVRSPACRQMTAIYFDGVK
jgi:hypothetical protein